jgi:type III secretion protein L
MRKILSPMETFIFIEKNRLRISPSTKLIKAKSYTSISDTEDIIVNAQKKAEQIFRSAKEDADRMREAAIKAYESEREKGYKDGLHQSQKEMATKINETLISVEQYLHGVEQKIRSLVMDTVSKVLDNMDKSELIHALVKKALTKMRNHKPIKLKIAPMHVDLLNARIMEMQIAYPNIDGIEIIADDRLSSNQVILESPMGIIDAGLETQLSAIQDAYSHCFSS